MMRKNGRLKTNRGHSCRIGRVPGSYIIHELDIDHRDLLSNIHRRHQTELHITLQNFITTAIKYVSLVSQIRREGGFEKNLEFYPKNCQHTKNRT